MFLQITNHLLFLTNLCQNGRGSSKKWQRFVHQYLSSKYSNAIWPGWRIRAGSHWSTLMADIDEPLSFFWRTSAILTEVCQEQQRLVNSPNFPQFWTYVFWRRYVQIICTDNLPNLIFVRSLQQNMPTIASDLPSRAVLVFKAWCDWTAAQAI